MKKEMLELARTQVHDGAVLSLHCRDNEMVIRVDGQPLMSNWRITSEEALASLGCRDLPDGARVLIGGLGMGFTLRAALAAAPTATVVVAEVSADVVTWNRTLLGAEAAATLADPRVQVHVGDVAEPMAEAAGFDAILLDVDNSPHALSRPGNQGLYDKAGLATARRALRPGGRLAIWSDNPYRAFERRLAKAGFAVSIKSVLAAETGGGRHTVYLATPRAPRALVVTDAPA